MLKSKALLQTSKQNERPESSGLISFFTIPKCQGAGFDDAQTSLSPVLGGPQRPPQGPGLAGGSPRRCELGLLLVKSNFTSCSSHFLVAPEKDCSFL